jgi:hypothetical protein
MFYNKDYHNPYTSTVIIIMLIRSKRIRWAEQVACIKVMINHIEV